jgi:chorismate mutase
MSLRGVRGAITVDNNTKAEIIAATKELLEQLISANKIKTEDIASALFSSTPGLDAEFPAVAARGLGWNETPLLCMQEISVPGSLANCIRVLIHLNTQRSQKEMKHVYLRAAVKLRRDGQ